MVGVNRIVSRQLQMNEEQGLNYLTRAREVLETEIADRLQISRTPVREAIRRLEAEGLVPPAPPAGPTAGGRITCREFG